MTIEIPIDYRSEDFKHVRLGKWNEYGRYEKGEDGKIKLVEKKEAPFSEYEKLISEGWKSLAKVPIEPWTNGRTYSDSILREHIEKDFNYGTVAGFNELTFIDVDNRNLIPIVDDFFKDTKLVETWSGKRHGVIKSNFGENKKLSCGVEIRSKNMQCVGVGSKGPNGECYKDINQKPIKFYPKEKIIEFIKLLDTPNKITFGDETTFVVGKGVDGSMSGVEFHEIGRLLKEGKTKEETFEYMRNHIFEKWNTHGEKYPQYRELTFENAKQFLINTNQLPQPKINVNSESLFWTIIDYENYKPSRNSIIEELMYPEEIEMVYSQSGHFKSLDGLYRAVCIVSGKKYLGKFRVKKCAVGIISAENHKKIDKIRLKAIMRGLKIRKKKLPLYILPRESCGDILEPQFRLMIEDFILKKGIKVLFIDTINPVTPQVDDNKAKDVTRIYNEFFKPLVDKYKITICFFHHTDKKATSFLGSMKFRANSDVVYFIDRKGLESKYTIYNEKNREGEIGSLEVGVEFTNNKKETKEIKFFLLKQSEQKGIGTVKNKTKGKLIEDKILSITTNQRKPRNEILQLCCDIGSKSTIDRVLGELVFRKKLLVNDEGYTKNETI